MHKPSSRAHCPAGRGLEWAVGVVAAALTATGVLLDAPLATALSLGAIAAGAITLLAGRRARARFLDAAGIVRVTIDTAGTILEWSPAGEQIFGYGASEVLGRNVSMLMPEPTASEHDSYLARCVENPDRPSRVLGARRQVTGRHRDGDLFALTLFVQPIRRRGRLAFEGLLQPIPDSGGQRQQPQQEDIAPQLSWRWLRNLGHEIRTPMAGIQGHAEILVDPHSTEPERQESAAAILQNSRHLVELLNDLLDHARLSAGQLPVQRQRIDLRSFVDEVVRMVGPNATHRGLGLDVAFDAAADPCVEADPLRLRQILLNLLGNAIKFTEAGWVRIEVAPSATAGADRICIDVADTGIGISSDFAKLLFQPFQQEQRGATGGAGSGLGLSICRRLARLLGGDLLLVDSVPGVGSRFRLELPRCSGAPAASAVAAPPAVTGAPPLARVRVLAVDDARDLLRLASRFLEAAGATVQAFLLPTEALRHAAAHAFDVALLDLMMPEMSGFELASELRRIGFQGPILALSADGDPDSAARCAEAGFDRLLSKPIRRAELVAAIEGSLRAAPADGQAVRRSPIAARR